MLEDADELFEKPTVLLIVALKGYLGFSLPLQQSLVEPVDVRQTVTLVITSEKEKILRVFDLEGQQEENGLNLHGPTALVIPEEEVVCLWWPPFHIKYLTQI